jgi:hypothetical protein
MAEIDEVMEERGCTFKDAQVVVNERREERRKDLPAALRHLSEPVSPSTFDRARAFVRGQLIEGRDGNTGYSRLASLDGEAS